MIIEVIQQIFAVAAKDLNLKLDKSSLKLNGSLVIHIIMKRWLRSGKKQYKGLKVLIKLINDLFNNLLIFSSALATVFGCQVSYVDRSDTFSFLLLLTVRCIIWELFYKHFPFHFVATSIIIIFFCIVTW